MGNIVTTYLFSPGQQSGSVWSNLAQMEKNNDITVRMLWDKRQAVNIDDIVGNHNIMVL